MELGFIGLGKMGMNMVIRLRRDDHRVVVFDRSQEAVAQAASQGCVGSTSLADMVSRLTAPRSVWIMVPAGAPTEETVQAVAALLQPGDIITRFDGQTIASVTDLLAAIRKKEPGQQSDVEFHRGQSWNDGKKGAGKDEQNGRGNPEPRSYDRNTSLHD